MRAAAAASQPQRAALDERPQLAAKAVHGEAHDVEEAARNLLHKAARRALDACKAGGSEGGEASGTVEAGMRREGGPARMLYRALLPSLPAPSRSTHRSRPPCQMAPRWPRTP